MDSTARLRTLAGAASRFPLISTTAKDLTGNLRRNLRRAQQQEPETGSGAVRDLQES